MAENPVFQKEDDGKWYFCDETWNEAGGPYDTEAEANKELNRYCIVQLADPYEIDRLVARKVFGANIIESEGDCDLTHTDKDECNEPAAWAECVKSFSTNRESAFMILDKFKHFTLGTTTVGNLAMDMYFCEIFNGEKNVMALGDTLPRAICFAGLLAVNGYEPDKKG